MMPIGASAQETESGNDTEYGTTSDAEGAAVEVSTETELIAALENGGNIMLTGDITVSDEYWGGYEITKNTTIDLNGHTITGVHVFTPNPENAGVVLTISGNGTFKVTDPDNDMPVDVWGTLNLLGGTIEGYTNVLGTINMSGGWVDKLHTDKLNSDDDTSHITGGYVRHLNCWGGILTISGGHAEALGIKYGTIIISGGTFGFDPTAYLAEGYTATEADGKWVVTCANGCEYTYSDNGDGTHTATCSVCGHKVTEEHSTEKDENKTNCQHGNICDLCGVEYSEPDPDAHSYNEDGFCEMCSTANPDETMFFIFDGDHKAFNVAEDLVGVNIEYTRGLHNTEWNSIYLPFEVPVTEGLLDEFEFAYVNDMHSADTDDNGEIDEIEMEIVKIKTGTLHANHPYFIRAKSEYTILQLSYENTTLHATEETTLNCSSIYMDYAIVGSYKHIKGTEFASMPADRYYAISIDGGWWQIPEDSSLYPFRAYLSMTARDGSPVKVSDEAMRSIRIREKGEGTTGIEEVKGENGEVKTIYDLQGRRVEIPNKGLYIINGKKVLIK
ncbi:MAG: hypothetical protein J6V23_09390 [Bacteroidaceae bacterium]|nr:hypothetical protein [Bacteroidaceae bacterium]